MLRVLADQAADAAVLESRRHAVGAASLQHRVGSLAATLRKADCSCVALYADNGIDWIVADLACLEAGVRSVPVPLFFTAAQVLHLLESSGADTLLADRPVESLDLDVRPSAGWAALPGLQRYAVRANTESRVPHGTWKITYTSGTTGEPKGVCLAAGQLLAVAGSLADATGLDSPRHLCILPLSTLLENVAGVYAPLLAGGTVVVPPLADAGVEGSTGLDVARLCACITAQHPDSLILVPEILRALTAAAERGWRPPSSLRFVAVGGSKVSPALLTRARQAGLPVFEGYGLSECGSVVALNVPGCDAPGTSGRPLPHVDVYVDGGEIVVAGSPMLGYVDDPGSWYPAEVRTGDLGRVDARGFVHVEGRSRNVLITGFGRNVSPEWVESELLAAPLLAQAVVVGDTKPWCSALVLPRQECTTDETISAWIRDTNERLPDYARVLDWRRLPEPLTVANGLLTANGRPRRPVIEKRYQPLIDGLYENQPEASMQ